MIIKYSCEIISFNRYITLALRVTIYTYASKVKPSLFVPLIKSFISCIDSSYYPPNTYISLNCAMVSIDYPSYYTLFKRHNMSYLLRITSIPISHS